MKILKYAVTTLVVLAAILVAVGFVLPDRAHVERSVVINAPPSEVFARVNNLHGMNEWSPWFEKDPNAENRFEGPESGVGSKMSWKSDNPGVGSGSQEIIASEPDRLVKTHLDFGAKGTATASFTVEAQGSGSRLTWGLDSEFGNDLIGRYFGLMFDGMIGPDYEKGLAKLKSLLEG